MGMAVPDNAALGLCPRCLLSTGIDLLPPLETLHSPAPKKPGAGRSGDYELLEEIAQSSITRNRQHFLRFELPVTFRTLIELGIQEEYSMGYAGEAGFRAGIAHPHSFYDLPREEQTSLILYPAVCMDGTLRDYQKLSVPEAESLVRELVEAVRSTGGTFVSIWHNSTVTERDDREGWRNLYTFLLGMITAQKHSAT